MPVTLGTLQLVDTGSLVRLFTEPSAREHLGGPLSHSDAEKRVAGLLSGDTRGRVWVIRPESGDAIGLVWLAPHHEEADPELSIVLLPEWQGAGHAFHAASRVLDLAFATLALPRVVAETQSANARCVALLKRLGMSRETTLQRFGVEQSLFAIRRERWGGGTSTAEGI